MCLAGRGCQVEVKRRVTRRGRQRGRRAREKGSGRVSLGGFRREKERSIEREERDKLGGKEG